MSIRKSRKELELFHSWLKRNGFKKTYQKDLILEIFLNAEGHLSVDDVYVLVKKRDRRVGVVTVFRTLKALSTCGIAREITLGDGLTRFEHGGVHPQHHHIICTKCGRALEFASPELERVQSEILKKYDFQPERYSFKTYGICADCRENRSNVASVVYDVEHVFARDAVKMALDIETRLFEFFRATAALNRDPEGSAVFTRLAGLKETRVAELKLKLQEIVNEGKSIVKAPVFLHYDPGKIERKIYDLARTVKEMKTKELRISADVAVGLVRSLISVTAEFFRDYAANFHDTSGERMLIGFADKEESHK
jgi:Fur family ferric uptake transcriptional regulator